MGAYLLPLDQWDTFGPTTHCAGGCLHCRDCRRGLHIDISSFIPVVDTTYNRVINATTNSFVVRSISLAVDTSKPVFVGTVMDDDGNHLRKCCEVVVGTCMVDFTTDYFGFQTYHLGALVVGANNYEVYFKITHSYADAEDTFLFSFKRDAGALYSPIEAPVCHIPRGVYTSMGNAVSADYETNKGYIEEFDEVAMPVLPVYCNSDGGYRGQGIDPVEPVPVTADYCCACVKCHGPTTYTLTLSDLSELCVNFKGTDVDSIELDFDLEFINGDTENPSGIQCFAINPLSDDQISNEHEGDCVLCDVEEYDECFDYGPTWTAQASIHFNLNGYPGQDGKNVQVVVTFHFDCNDPGGFNNTTFFAFFYFTWECDGGIVPSTFETETDYGTISASIA